ncbi:MAG: TrkH family potassium uptake protein [Clostridia bacterium]|nr:TrkH family potassium uptake protein [Clostridia bacterium]
MNKKMVFRAVGKISQILSVLLLVPAIVAVIYGETKQIFAFVITAAVSFGVGSLISLITKTKNRVIYAKDGFTITALAWIILAVIGAIPFVISGDISSYVDAVFETASGFTTTGASVITNVEGLSRAALFWRSFTHWIGGMGVLVFVMALMPNFTDRSIHIMRAEMPGPIVGKLVPRVKDTAKILYLIYIVLTMLQIVLLFCGGMPIFDSIIHSLGTAGTGGFSLKADGLASYSPYCQWVITIFMLIFGVNFNLYYLLLMKKVGTAVKSGELWAYLSLAVVSTIFITFNIMSQYSNFADSLRHSAFQVSSIMTTTGYSTTDFNSWPDFSKSILVILMFCGGCAGSTAGGLKIARVVMLFKNIKREIRQMIHKRSVNAVRFEGKVVDETTFSGVMTYLAIYLICVLLIFLLLSLEPFGFETNFTATVACFNNVGPGLAGVGPTSSYAAYSDLSKILLSFAMLFGRLEIFPMLIMLSPRTWLKK